MVAVISRNAAETSTRWVNLPALLKPPLLIRAEGRLRLSHGSDHDLRCIGPQACCRSEGELRTTLSRTHASSLLRPLRRAVRSRIVLPDSTIPRLARHSRLRCESVPARRPGVPR